MLFVDGVYSPTDVLPPPSEEFNENTNIKKITEYKFNEDGKKIKVINVNLVRAHTLAPMWRGMRQRWGEGRGEGERSD